MLNSNLNIYGKEWLDVVFNSKNKNYGAYQLRKQNSSITTTALWISSAAFILLFLTPKIISLIRGADTDDFVKTETVVKIQDLPLTKPVVIPPAPVHPPAAKEPSTVFKVPVVVQDKLVDDIEPPSVTDLKNSNPGQRTMAGVPEGDIVIIGPVGDGPKQAAVVEDNNEYKTITLEVQPSFPGGINKFYEYLRKTVRYPAMAQEQGIQGKAFMSFVIERNGDLTDISVANRIGGGIDEEAVRVLKASPAWLPGIQNGKPVRVRFNIPISFSLPE
jgi:protein TonB